MKDCEECDEDSFQDLVGAVSCKPCPSGFKTNKRGATSESECIYDEINKPNVYDFPDFLFFQEFPEKKFSENHGIPESFLYLEYNVKPILRV